MDDSGDKDAAIKGQVSCSMGELHSKLGTGSTGLSQDEAAARLKKFGPNLLPEQAKLKLYKKLLEQFRNLFNVLLLIAASLSFISGITANDATSYQMGFAIIIVVLISVFFSIFQERRAEKAVDAIKDLVPRNAKVYRDGQVKQLQIADIVPGDVVSLEEGDKVPADARIINCYEFSVDNSTLTGESDPQKRMAMEGGEVASGDLYKCGNLIFAGTTVSSGSGTAVVLRTGADTEFGRIVSMAQNIVEPPSPLQKELDGTAKLNFVVAIGVGLLFLFVAYFFLGLELTPSLLFMIGVMVSLTPEGLQVTVTLSLAMSSLAMSKRNVIVKRLSSVETLGSCTVICSDKTGTITEGQMTVRMAWVGGKTFVVSGEGYGPDGFITLDGQKVAATDRPDLLKLCQVAALDNTATLVPPLDRKKSRWTAIGDSTDAALLVLAAKSGLQPKQLLSDQPRIGMVPFDSNRKMMSSIHQDGRKATAYVKGAGNEILSRCDKAYWNGEVAPLNDEMRLQIRGQMDGFAKGAYRVLALSYCELPGQMEKYTSDSVEKELTFIGLVAIYDPPRLETPEAVHKARSAGIRIVMITGDHELTAEAIARKVGIVTSDDATVMTGYKLAQLSEGELSKVLEARELVFARITPEQKLRIVRAFRANGETVAVTGDGVNDAPALLEADIGVAMGISGTDVARESADMVLLDDNFASIVNGIEEGRAVFDNLKRFIIYAFCHNWAELMTFIAFILLGTPLPLAVMQVLAIDLLMEIPPSLSITMEPPEPGIMERAPRQRGTKLFDKWALARSAYIGILIGAYALFWCFLFWSSTGWHFGEMEIADKAIYAKGTTIVMVGIMAGQLGTLFAMRTNVKSAFSISISRNMWLVTAVVAEILLLIILVYVPFLHPAFSTDIIDPFYWLALYSFAPVILLSEEARKFVLRRRLALAVPVPVPAPVPVAPAVSAPAPTFTFAEPKPAARFIERAPPVLLPVSMKDEEANAVIIGLTMARQRGSRAVIVRVMEKAAPEWLKKKFDIIVHDFAAEAVHYEYVDVEQPSGTKESSATASAMRKLIKDTGAEVLVVPVSRGLISGKRKALREYSWLKEFSDRKVILVSAGPHVQGQKKRRQFRILIPVLSAFHQGPFELASALTENAVVPDVDVVATKVVEMPAITPLYSIYKPESLVNVSEQLSFLKNVKGLPLQKVLHPKVLLVRRARRDLVDFASERGADIVIMEGDWSAASHGFLKGEEREVAAGMPCTVVLTLSPDSHIK